MLVIGLVGGIASGKSFVAECFANLGAEVLDADKIGHEVLADPDVIVEVQRAWPNVVDDGKIDRKALANIVFRFEDHKYNLQKLESITHPQIGQRIDQRISFLRSAGLMAAVLDAPVLFKASWQNRCDKIVFVETTLEIRLKRAAARGWSHDELIRREQSQTPLPQKRQLATDIINNSQSKKETQQQAQALWVGWGLTLPL